VLDEVDGLLAQGHRALIESFYGKIPKESNGRRLQVRGECVLSVRARVCE
jgi:hypothetical protein